MVSSFLEIGDFDRRCTRSNNDSTVMEATTPAEAAARIRNSVTINPDMRVLQGSYIQPNSRAATQMITARFRKIKFVREPQPSFPSRVPGETRWRKPCVTIPWRPIVADLPKSARDRRPISSQVSASELRLADAAGIRHLANRVLFSEFHLDDKLWLDPGGIGFVLSATGFVLVMSGPI